VIRPFKRRRRDQQLVVTLPEATAQVLRNVVADLTQVLEEPTGAVGERLYPRAYLDPTEERAEQTWQSLVHDDLRQSRVDAVGAVVADIDGARPASRGNVEIVLDEVGETRWLTVLNDARLTLGTALGVTEDEALAFPPGDSRQPAADIYVLLTMLQGELVEAALAIVPQTGQGDE
jgi:hypothetical protein